MPITVLSPFTGGAEFLGAGGLSGSVLAGGALGGDSLLTGTDAFANANGVASQTGWDAFAGTSAFAPPQWQAADWTTSGHFSLFSSAPETELKHGVDSFSRGLAVFLDASANSSDAPTAPPPASSGVPPAAAPPATPPSGGNRNGRPRGTKENPVEIADPDGADWKIPKPMTQEFIDKLVKAIVAQDGEIYPDGDIKGMTSGSKSRDRAYRIAGRTIALRSILSWTRSAMGFGVHDDISRSIKKIIDDLKLRLFGIEPKEPAEHITIPIAINFPLPLDSHGQIDAKKLTATQIDEIVKAIVAQDRELYPDGSVENFSTSARFVGRRYMIGSNVFRLDTVISWVRILQGKGASDFKSVPRSQVIKDWKQRLFKIAVAQPAEHAAFPIIIGFELPTDLQGRIDAKKITTAQIDEMVKAIVSQDHEFYPEGSTRNMTTASRCLYRWYKIGGYELELTRIVGWWRIASGLKAGSKDLSSKAIVDGWKSRLFVEELPEHIAIPIAGEFGLPMDTRGQIDTKRLTAIQIDKIVRAIVAQDREFYPDGAVRGLSTNSRRMSRRYKFGNIEISFEKVVRWSRRINQVAMNADGSAAELSEGDVIRDWKSRLFGIDVTPVEHAGIPINIGFELSENGTLSPAQIDTIVRAIVSQDREFYPEGSAANMSSAPKCQNRRYRIGNRVLRFGAVVGWARRARGLKTSDNKVLPDKSIIDDWKMRLFGIETRDTEHESIPITIDFELPLSVRKDVDTKKLTLDQTDAIVRAIIEQDSKFYSNGEAQRMSTAKSCFHRWYKIGNKEITLLAVSRWVRVKKGYAIGDTKSLPQKTIIDDWKRRLFGIDTRAMTADEFNGWVESHGLADVVRALENSPNALEDFIRALYPEMSDHEIVRLMRVFAELRLGTGWKPAGGNGGAGDAGDPLIEAIFMRREMLEGMSVEQRARLVRAMKAHWEKSFNRDPEGTIAALSNLSSRVADPRVQGIISDVMRLFSETSNFAVGALKTELMPFQREGARFLASRNAAILADEPGLGKTIQAIAAAEYLRETGKLSTAEGGSKVLIIAPAGVKRTWVAQLSTDPSVGHLAKKRKVVVIEGDREKRHKLAISAKTADYVVVNYEYLVNAPENEISAITDGLAIKIVDEAQMVQNPSEKILRANAVRKIRAERTWYLTATPYFANVENIWTHLNDLEPGKHGTLAAFRTAHAGDEVGLVTLHRRMQDLMLRRRKIDVLGTYDPLQPPDAQPLLLPQMKWVDPVEEGSYKMSAEQQEASLLLLTDFEGFWGIYGTNNGREASDVSPMERLEMLFKIIHEPEAYGLNGRESKEAALDDIVKRRMAAGQKVVLYANRRVEAARLVARYSEFGSVLFWGGMNEAQKEKAREDFQDGSARIIVGTEAMMFGIDLTAADALVLTQMPWTYPEIYQLKDRLQRLDSRHRKASVDIVRLVGNYPGLAGASSEELGYLQNGSYDELLARHIESSRQIYDIVMDLPYLENRLDRLIKESLGKSVFGDMKGRQKKALEAGQAFYPLYVAARSFDASEQERAQSAVVALAELYADHASATQRIVAVYQKYLDSSETLPIEEMELIAKLSQMRNKYLRGIVLEELPQILDGIHSEDKTLDEAIPHEGEARSIHLLGWLIAGGDALSGKLDELPHISESEMREDIMNRLEQGILRLLPERLKIAEFLGRYADAISEAGVEDVAELFDRIGTAMSGSSALFEMFIEQNFRSVSEMIELLRSFELDIYFDNLHLLRSDDNKNRMRALIPEGLDGFLMLAKRYESSGLATEGAQLREIFEHVVSGDFDSWRTNNNAISYLSHDEEFWNGFNTPIRTRVAVDSGAVDVNTEIADSYNELIDSLKTRAAGRDLPSAILEHAIVWEWLGKYLEMNADGKARYLNSARSAYQALGRISARVEAGVEINSQDVEFLRNFGLVRDLGDVKGASYRKRITQPLGSLVVWLEGLEAARAGIEGGERKGIDRALATLSSISKQYQTRLAGAKDAVATPLSQLDHLLRHRHWSSAGKKIVIEDTADWRVLLNIGRLYPELINCLAPDGDADFTRTLVDLLASKNKRLVIARDEESGEILSVGVLKVRQTSDGRPALHLERPFGRKGSKFEAQMLEHIKIKKQKMGQAGQNALMTKQARTATARSAGVKLRTTGSAAGLYEYVEDFFHVAPVDWVGYNAEVVGER